MIIENAATILYGSGFITSLILVDTAIILCGIFLMKVLVIPTVKTYHKAKSIDKLFGTDKSHWFYGHLFKVRFGFLKKKIVIIMYNYKSAIILVIFLAILRHFHN